MQRHHYSMHIAWSEEDGAFVASCPEFDGVSGLGATADIAAAELNTAIELAIEEYARLGDALPDPLLLANFNGRPNVRIPKSLHARLTREAEREGVSLNALIIARLSASDAATAAAERVRDLVVQRIESLA